MNREEKRKQFQVLKAMKPDQFWSAMNVLHTKAYATCVRHYHQAMRELFDPETMAAVIKKANEIRIGEGMVTIDTNQTEVEIFYPEEADALHLGVPMRDREMQSQGSGEVHVTKLSPEQMEREFERMNGGKHTPSTVPNQKEDEDMNKRRGPALKEGPACGLTKKDFLKSIAEGETIASIEKAWSMKYNTLHDWVKKWGFKGITPGKARELLAAMDPEETPVMVTAEVATPEVAEVVVESSERNNESSEIEVETQEEQVVALEKSEPVVTTPATPIILLDRTQHQAYISVAIPLIISNEPKLAKRDKAYESMSRLLSDGVDSTSLDYPVLAADILEILQVVVSLVYDQTSAVVVKPDKALEAVQEFFGHHNQEHLKRMELLLGQDGWRKISV
jgi:transposase-like protein